MADDGSELNGQNGVDPLGLLNQRQQLNLQIKPAPAAHQQQQFFAPVVTVFIPVSAAQQQLFTNIPPHQSQSQYPLPLQTFRPTNRTISDDIFAKLINCKVFSQIDLSDAFLQVEVDEQYRKLLTINTRRCLYSYNRLPPGVKIAPGAFQQLIDTMLAGLQCKCGYLDDVIVGGKTEEDRDRNLRVFLKRIQVFGFTIRVDKCTFRKQQVQYVGHIVDSRGLRSDPAKIEVISKLLHPTDVSGVRSFLGAIN
ncbi:uncharacterized protein K02A2.6-like [Topomyia yanbarensis]|uniref:uncharacterized protein K02A2.6-like n=1 Tax=Topomyia yanbarensis TaxID=2498891 RepID=UPI00273B752E|nr:uncharacterized protein K02A2.6-like [Topomyia yanbarensis]